MISGELCSRCTVVGGSGGEPRLGCEAGVRAAGPPGQAGRYQAEGEVRQPSRNPE